jgi:GDP/UDP-N,N'-diacetylbacillosamine 2-epimerase (hydrolysing)
MPRKRKICFVTGTRAEFGLMRRVLNAIGKHPDLALQIVVTGMHLSKRHGRTMNDVAREFKADAVVPWKSDSASPTDQAIATGNATAALARAFDRLRSDIVLIVGDRVEAFAAASAAHLSGRIVAHVHGGDRAAGQVDDTLRHAITKLSHLHFPATVQSARRIARLGEDPWRIHRVGSPGVESITSDAARNKARERFALLVLHPQDIDEQIEQQRAKMIFDTLQRVAFDRIVIV